MRGRKSRFKPDLNLAILAVAALAVSAGVLAANKQVFLDRLDTINLVGSTVPNNGDINPYGVAVIRNSVGSLKSGNILISNFNNSNNQQGTGTTIVQVSPKGKVSLFAQIDPSTVAGECPGGVGLTTALTVLRRGWVIVGSLPTSNGMSPTAQAGCLIVLNSDGQVVETFAGGGINGPWDMTSLDQGDKALLFVTNVLNGDVTVLPIHTVNEGTVLRISLEVPKQGDGMPTLGTTTEIGSGFSETADPNALIIGPTGVGLADDGTLYVADTFNSRIAAIPDAVNRQTTAFTGVEVSSGGALMGPLGLAIAPNGNIITANAGDGNLVETAPNGSQVAVKTVETATGAGSLFGIAIARGGPGVYFVDDGDNTLKIFENKSENSQGND
jgi:hypothetical protein